jgi:hypothetical protein
MHRRGGGVQGAPRESVPARITIRSIGISVCVRAQVVYGLDGEDAYFNGSHFENAIRISILPDCDLAYLRVVRSVDVETRVRIRFRVSSETQREKSSHG